MFVLVRTVLEGVEEVVKGKSTPGPGTVLSRIKRFADQYDEQKAKREF
jgi:hypothetical protein